MLRLKTSLEQDEFEAYIEALFKLDGYHNIHKELDRLKVPAPYRLRIKVLYSEISVNKVMDGLVEEGILNNLKKESKTYTYNTTIGNQIAKKISVPFFLVSCQPSSDG